ncbi:hypothetical protein E2C01_019137 [Portunus trituberculatus]|uniref:Uncharacterized protein n=1 Tax=Portunus trituberculatus TaxID=210409 RepID=A0A5B7DWU8_PORTR|nr:hypothetical protein [Portunus trituberculatus]
MDCREDVSDWSTLNSYSETLCSLTATVFQGHRDD